MFLTRFVFLAFLVLTLGVAAIRQAVAAPSVVAAPETISTDAQEIASAQPESREIFVDCRSVAGPMSTVYKRCVGAGRANEGLRADWQQQLLHAKHECGFEYIRMHGLLCDDMGVYQEDSHGNPKYNWQYIDDLYDYLISIHVRPIVEIGFMPSALASGSQTIFWWKGNVTPPKDYGKWAGLITALVRHWSDRYGADEVKQWYFEVWNEPNLEGFWTGGEQEYFKLYSVTANAIKQVSPDLRVGGPATAGNGWISDFINYCVTTHTPVDFISTHSYGVDVGFLDEHGDRGTALSHNPNSMSGDVAWSREQINASPLPHLPLLYTEWSASYTPADPIHDSYVEAPYILDKLNKAMPNADAMSYWTFTDIFEEAGPRFTPFHGGFGLINLEGIDKPAFRAYQYMNMLGPTRLVCSDDRSMITKDAKGNLRALFWDFTNTLPDHTNDQDYYIKDIVPKLKYDADLRIAHLKSGRYRLLVYRVGYRINDPYEDYLDMGRPDQLTRPQVAWIKEHNSGEPVHVENVTIGSSETLKRHYPMRENDVYLVRLDRME